MKLSELKIFIDRVWTETDEDPEVKISLDVSTDVSTGDEDFGLRDFASELGDIVCCCLVMAGKERIDIEKAVSATVEKNHKRAEGTGDKL